ncbi:hypothetical protein RintRC_1320 [Richelia intracellularis]|nr:hypothetical protein RintRC_1320 [Richelia intracellularis]
MGFLGILGVIKVMLQAFILGKIMQLAESVGSVLVGLEFINLPI